MVEIYLGFDKPTKRSANKAQKWLEKGAFFIDFLSPLRIIRIYLKSFDKAINTYSLQERPRL